MEKKDETLLDLWRDGAFEGTWKALYMLFSVLIGLLTFVGSWVYAVLQYGFLLGVGLGWIPAFFIGVLAGLLWPLALLAVIGFFLFLY